MTLKEVPNDATVISHQLMLRAGMIRKLSSGIYSWLPLGLRVLRKVEHIIREEMNRAGALELLMPAVQPAELWQESGRWEKYGPELLRISDRHANEFCFGPTHEEVITHLVSREIKSYKQLPLNFYQIQTKFRDEIRPRFGVMRSREFIMKDAYSFHLNEESLQQTYQVMHNTYTRIFERTGLHFRAVQADSGAIGGNASHEFHVLADSGEDAIAFSDKSDYAANVEQAAVIPTNKKPKIGKEKCTVVDTPNQKTIEEVAAFLKVEPNRCVKTLIIKDSTDQLFALILRGDHELNEIKVQKLPHINEPFRFATSEDIKNTVGCSTGSLGPVSLNIPVFVDQDASLMSDFICGANQDDRHCTGVNWERDAKIDHIVDIRNVVDGDPSPDGQGHLRIARGIEVGHIFQLGTKYSDSMNANVLDDRGKSVNLTMGCYGIGVTRVVAAAIEQNHDDHGIVWPSSIAPFQVAILPLNYTKSHRVREAAENLYQQCIDLGIDVIIEDTKIQPGVMFATMELIGIPHRIIVAERGLDKGELEYKARQDKESTFVKSDDIIALIQSKLK